MNKPKLWAALLAATLFAAALLCGGCKDFFHPEGPTKASGTHPLTDEQAADAFRKIETVKEALEINVEAIGLDAPADDLTALEAKVDKALADYEELPQGARSALSAEKAKLDSIKEKIGHVNSAQAFQKEHEATLAKTPEKLDSAEEAAVLLPVLKAAFEAIEALPEGAQELLEDDIALLEDLKAKAEELTAPPPQYTITFDSHGGSAVEAITEDEETAVPKPADPTLDGYTFLGWFDAETGGVRYSWPHTLTESITAHARWQEDSLPPPTQYTITFDTHNGSEPSSETANEGTAINKPADPARTGYGFDGWFPTASGGAEHTAWPHTLTENITVHAQWTAIEYGIVYHLNGGNNDDANPAAYTIESGEITLADPKRNGYDFGGWYDNGGFAGSAVTEIPAGSTEAKTFHARWTAISYAIVYELYGGVNHAENPATYTIESPAIALKDPTHATREFQDWYTGPGFNEADLVAAIPAASTGPKTFYARWKPLAPPIGTTLLEPAADPALAEQVVVFEGSTDTFTAAGDYADHEWYWDSLISGQTGPTYALTGEEDAGIHELSVVATGGGGNPLSARCKVIIIKAEQGGAE